MQDVYKRNNDLKLLINQYLEKTAVLIYLNFHYRYRSVRAQNYPKN